MKLNSLVGRAISPATQKLRTHSDPSGSDVSNLIGADSLDAVDDTSDVLESIEVSLNALSERGVQQGGVVGGNAGVLGKQDEVGGGESGSSEVGSAISPSGVVLVELSNRVIDGLVDDFLVSALDEEGRSELLLVVVDVGLTEPGHLVDFLVGGGNDTVLVGEVGENSGSLVLDRAIVLNQDGDLVALTVGTGGLDDGPVLKGEADIFELDTLAGEEVADRLGATLDIEVDKLWHLIC